MDYLERHLHTSDIVTLSFFTVLKLLFGIKVKFSSLEIRRR